MDLGVRLRNLSLSITESPPGRGGWDNLWGVIPWQTPEECEDGTFCTPPPLPMYPPPQVSRYLVSAPLESPPCQPLDPLQSILLGPRHACFPKIKCEKYSYQKYMKNNYIKQVANCWPTNVSLAWYLASLVFFPKFLFPQRLLWGTWSAK